MSVHQLPVKDRGNPPEPPDMEARVSRIEAWAEHTDRALTDIKQDIRDMRKDMREDFRILFGVIAFVALGLAGLMAKGFGWL